MEIITEKVLRRQLICYKKITIEYRLTNGMRVISKEEIWETDKIH